MPQAIAVESPHTRAASFTGFIGCKQEPLVVLREGDWSLTLWEVGPVALVAAFSR